MAKLISLFNHKGGVSKTTTAFNLGWMLARRGKRVLLVDCDPQCNLTGTVLGFEHLESTESIEGTEDGAPLNIREGLAPAFEARPTGVIAVKCVEVPSNNNLFLLPGHIGLAEYEVTLGIAQELSGSLITLRNLPGSMHALVTATAEKYDIDLVLFDMSPSLGAVNQNLWAISDYFLIPMNPDYFSLMAIDSLAKVFPRWKVWRDKAAEMDVLMSAEYPFPDSTPKYLGYVMQKFRPRGQGAPSRAFQQWIDQVQARMANVLLPVLEKNGLLLDDEKYNIVDAHPSEPILQMSDFNALIARSQEHQVPVFELTNQQLDQAGVVLERTKESMVRFKALFQEAADKVIALTDDEESV